MSKVKEYKDLIAFHPGSYVEDIIEELNITQNEFAERLGTSSKTISKIVNGEEKISDDIANKLSKLTGISLETWLNLQTNYDIKVLEIENLKDEDEARLCEMIDFSYFKRQKFIADKKYSIKEKISTLRKLLKRADLSDLFEFNSAVSYRNTREFNEKSIVNSNIMLELAADCARNETTNKFNKSKLISILPQIREMTVKSPETFFPELKKILLECGIILVALPKLKNANLNGATKKFRNGSIMLLITDRNKMSDIFWFSILHEIGHIYHEDFYSNYRNQEEYTKNERRADEFASNFFIPQEKYDEFISNGDFSELAIKTFSKQLDIHPSIVVGRLQNFGYIKYNSFNYLKNSYSMVSSE